MTAGSKISDIIVYVICSGSATFIVIIAIALTMYRRKRYIKLRRRWMRRENAMAQTQTQMEGKYETFLCNVSNNDVYGREYYCCQNYERVSNSQCVGMYWCHHVEGCMNESTTLLSADEDFTFKSSFENNTAASGVIKYDKKDAIVIYIICSGVLLVLILSACLAMKYCRRKDVFQKSHTTIPTVPTRQNITIV
ncbi:unnamed protein product [Mytilus coruscus]|uniref:Uncharacterized protein n=1 Tax=Mytilus coruscus TaxID=42192 RepID=A0A6J8CSK9_MYTCO|nr:unnamed protein product [Mytilus coruscus]